MKATRPADRYRLSCHGGGRAMLWFLGYSIWRSLRTMEEEDEIPRWRR